MVMRQGLGLIAIGLLVGSVGFFAIVGLMSTVLFEVQPTDPITFLLVTVTLLVIASAACFIPARRAVTIDPMSALRMD
jgi:ABC-type antimicrobial peptide transport system permease subunit